ncbi:ketosamine-3-kinase-like [Anomalospiza imberbis]|uniref:ketosamine-3-kinase-like n=1 Tax=Anomalospiza imberbis TaxID=187417 RepID=UPI00358E9595
MPVSPQQAVHMKRLIQELDNQEEETWHQSSASASQSIKCKGQGQVEVQVVDQFGFHTVTCCGNLPQHLTSWVVPAQRLCDPQKVYLKNKQICLLCGVQLTSAILVLQVNNWCSDWVSFFARQRIQPQMGWIKRSSGDRKAWELWTQLQVQAVLSVLIRVIAGYQLSRLYFLKTKFLFVGVHQVLSVEDSMTAVLALWLKIPSFFCGVEIVPSLLHGDLWGGNVAENDSGLIIFDPASFYGHSEYDLAIAGTFGGFSSSFYSAYHSKIPRAAGFEKRLKFYQLFHYMNHWNHFGSGYRGSYINIMRNLVK